MQLAVGLLAGLGGAGGAGAAAAGAGAAAVGAGAAAAGGVSALSILSGVATIAGVLGTLKAGQVQAQSYKEQAQTTDLEAKNEAAQGIKKQTGFKQELMRVFGENAVNFAASGIDLGQGIAADAAYDARNKAAQELTIDRYTTDARAASLRAQAAGYRRMATSAKNSAKWAAVGQAAQGIISFGQRGG